MKFSLLTLAVLSLVNADNVRSTESRRLSFEKVAGYTPGSQVTDHCAIDLDQAAIETELAKATDDSYKLAKRIYNQGAHSKSYAEITLASGLPTSINKGKAIIGKDSQGTDVAGVAYATYQAGETTVRFQYGTTDIQSSYVNCQVGALGEAGNLDGCLAASGSFNIEGTDYAYTYDPNTNNDNGRSIAGFSTQAGDKMRNNCPGCPYTDYMYFYRYYGAEDYANQWVTAALDGTSTNFDNGNADFSKYSFTGRKEAVKKGTVFLNIFMYVIREFEDALDDCKKNCIDCNDDPVHAWDEGVCFYTGSLEGQDGLTSDGKLLHQLADKRCANFKTCGRNSGEVSGTAKVNYDLFEKYELGKQQLQNGECDAARITTAEITKMMYIPFIQGALRYAYKLDVLNEGEKAAAEGAAFAAAVLPRIHDANPEAAKTIYDNLKVGATGTKFMFVKSAFESVYSDLGITCRDIGGLYNDALESYFEGMEPCGGAFSAASTTGTAVAAIVGAAAALFMGFF